MFCILSALSSKSGLRFWNFLSHNNLLEYHAIIGLLFPDHSSSWLRHPEIHWREPEPLGRCLGCREGLGWFPTYWPSGWHLQQVFLEAGVFYAEWREKPKFTTDLHSDSHAWCFTWLYGGGFQSVWIQGERMFFFYVKSWVDWESIQVLFQMRQAPVVLIVGLIQWYLKGNVTGI